MKTENQKAWFFVLPVLLLVALPADFSCCAPFSPFSVGSLIVGGGLVRLFVCGGMCVQLFGPLFGSPRRTA